MRSFKQFLLEFERGKERGRGVIDIDIPPNIKKPGSGDSNEKYYLTRPHYSFLEFLVERGHGDDTQDALNKLLDIKLNDVLEGAFDYSEKELRDYPLDTDSELSYPIYDNFAEENTPFDPDIRLLQKYRNLIKLDYRFTHSQRDQLLAMVFEVIRSSSSIYPQLWREWHRAKIRRDK